MKRLFKLLFVMLVIISGSALADDNYAKCNELLPKFLQFSDDCQTIRGIGRHRLNFFSSIPTTVENKDNGMLMINSVITMPSGTNVKWKVDLLTGNLTVEPPPTIIVMGPSGSSGPLAVGSPVDMGSTESKSKKSFSKEDEDKHNSVPPPIVPYVISYLGVVGNVGFLPNTSGIDVKPLEVIVLGGHMLRGSIEPVRLVGAVKVLENADIGAPVVSDKLIALLPGTPLEASGLANLDGLTNAGIKTILETWITNYKGDFNKSKVLEFLDVGNPNDFAPQNTAWAIVNQAKL